MLSNDALRSLNKATTAWFLCGTTSQAFVRGVQFISELCQFILRSETILVKRCTRRHQAHMLRDGTSNSRLELVLEGTLDLQKLQLEEEDGARLDDFSALHISKSRKPSMFSEPRSQVICGQHATTTASSNIAELARPQNRVGRRVLRQWHQPHLRARLHE